MIKKLLALSICSVAASSVFAGQSSTPYIGASAGVVSNTSTKALGNNAGAFRGVPFKVFAGYGGMISQSVYLAGELGGVAGTAQMSNKNNMRTSYGYRLSVLPGVMLSDQTLAYLRGGMVRTEFSNVNNMVTGAEMGVGLQTFLTQNFDLRAEYDYTAYRTVSGIHAPSADGFDLGIVYNFN